MRVFDVGEGDCCSGLVAVLVQVDDGVMSGMDRDSLELVVRWVGRKVDVMPVLKHFGALVGYFPGVRRCFGPVFPLGVECSSTFDGDARCSSEVEVQIT